MLLVGTQMKYLVITKQVGIEMHVDDQYIANHHWLAMWDKEYNGKLLFLSILHPCRIIVCWQVALLHSGLEAASQLASYNDRAMSYTLDEWGGLSVPARTHKHETILFDCLCRQTESSTLVSTDSQQWTTSIHSSVHYIY